MKKIVLLFALLFTGNMLNATIEKNQFNIDYDEGCGIYASSIALEWETPGTDAYNDLYYRMYDDCVKSK